MLRSLGCNDLELQKLEDYTDSRVRKFVSTLSINCIPILITECILQEIISSLSVELIIKFFCAVMFTER